MLAHSGARVVFCEDAAQVAKVEQVRERCPGSSTSSLFEDDGTARSRWTSCGARRARSTPDAVARAARRASAPDDVATLVYTSGTTGPPKGCMLSHGNLLATARHVRSSSSGFDDTHSLYQFLPLAHVLARVAQSGRARAWAARIVYWSGDPERIVDELRETRPTHFPAVPRIYEKIHGAALGRVGERAARAAAAVRLGAAVRHAARAASAGPAPAAGSAGRPPYRLADRLVLVEGARRCSARSCSSAMIGAAPIAPELLEFFDACGVLVLEGYGLTETCAAATLNTPDAFRFGHGRQAAAGHARWRSPTDGEILIRGPHVFRGYYSDPSRDRGDADRRRLAALRRPRARSMPTASCTITGRKKDLIITSSGKNISPVNIES